MKSLFRWLFGPTVEEKYGFLALLYKEQLKIHKKMAEKDLRKLHPELF